MSLSKRLIVLAFVHLLVSQNVYASGLYGIGSRFRRDSDVDHLEPYQPNQKTPVPFGPHDSIQNYHPSVDPKSALHKRADEHFYDAFKCKGEQALNRIMHDPPSARVYTRQDQVAAWSPLQRRGAVSPELLPAVRALGIPTDPNVVKGVATFQSKQVITPDGQSHPPTNGAFDNLFIPSGSKSAIIAVSNHSPAQYKRPNEPVPALHRWSDVVWQNWTGIAGSNDAARQLRYVIRENIFTTSTRKLIEYIEVAGKDDLDLPWPGHVYDMRSDDGKALLGTVHGMGVAWLIIDHSDVLGRKIPAIRVFSVPSKQPPARRPSKYLYYLVFELRNTVEGPD